MFKNFTPHSINIMNGEKIIEIPSEGISIRLTEKVQSVRQIEGIQICKIEYSETTLPPIQEGVYLIVSKIVAEAYPQRDDLFFPAEIIRDKNGKIIGCKSLTQL